MNLRSCILNRRILWSHFVICRILWSWPWRHTLSPITLKTCSGYLGEYPGSLLTWIWKVSFLPILALFHCYISYKAHNLYKGNLIDSVRRRCVHVSCTEEYTLLFLPSQNAITNCDNSVLAVAFCYLSHFVIMAVTAQTESNNTENAHNFSIFCPFGRYFTVISVCVYVLPIIECWHRCVHVSCTEEYTLLHYGHESEKLHNRHKMRQSKLGQFRNPCCRIFDLSHFVIMAVTAQNESNNIENVFWVENPGSLLTWIWKVSFLPILALFHSYKAHNRFTKETLLKVSDVDVYMFPVLRSIPSCTTDMNLRSCILNRHKMRQSQIATIQESLPSHFVICRILWSWPWRHTLSPITLKTCSGYLGEYPCSLLTWIWKVVFLPILALFHCYICLCVCISVIKPIYKGSLIDSVQRRCVHLYWGVYPLALRTWIWEVAFWTVTKCDSRLFCDLSHFVIMALTAHTESNNTENVFWVLGRVLPILAQWFILTWIWKVSCTYAHFGMNLRSCILNRPK